MHFSFTEIVLKWNCLEMEDFPMKMYCSHEHVQPPLIRLFLLLRMLLSLAVDLHCIVSLRGGINSVGAVRSPDGNRFVHLG